MPGVIIGCNIEMLFAQNRPFDEGEMHLTRKSLICDQINNNIFDLGVQQCFGVVYHELTVLRRIYFARAK